MRCRSPDRAADGQAVIQLANRIRFESSYHGYWKLRRFGERLIKANQVLDYPILSMPIGTATAV